MNIRVPAQMLPGLALLGLHGSKLPLLGDIAGQLGPRASLDALRREFAKRGEISVQDADSVIGALVSLLHLIELTEGRAQDATKLVTADLEERAPEKWQSDNLVNWRSSLESITSALDPDGPLAILHKTVELTTAHQNVFEAVQILTDIRPVFNSAASSILRAVVTHMLTISFRDDDGRLRTQYFALDSKDVERLKRRCERALMKAATIKTGLSPLSWPTEVAGEEE